MATREAFDRANALGRLAEQKVSHVFVDAGFETEWRPRGSRRDLSVKHPQYGKEFVEVKNEDNYAEKPNVCIELHQRGRESGLLISESTIYVSTAGEMCLAFRTQPARNWIARKMVLGHLVEQSFGDNDNSGVIIPKVMLAMQPFAEWIELSKLPWSRVLLPVAVAV